MAGKSKIGNENEAFTLPVDHEMNSNRVLFGFLSHALQFCGLKSENISHLSRIRMIRRKLYYAVPGVVCFTT